MNYEINLLYFQILNKCQNYYILKDLRTNNFICVQTLLSWVGNYLINLFQKIISSPLSFNSSTNYEFDLNRDSYVVDRFCQFFPIPHYLGIQIVSRVRFLISINFWPTHINLDEYLPPHLINSSQFDEKLIDDISPWLFGGRLCQRKYFRLLTATFYYTYKEALYLKDNFKEEEIFRLLESPLLFVLLSVYNLRPELADEILKI